MKTCCGRARNSNFCPDCGAVIGGARIGLLAHVNAMVKLYKEKHERWAAHALRETDRIQKRLRSAEKTLRKWTAWRDWILSTPDDAAPASQPAPAQPEGSVKR